MNEFIIRNYFMVRKENSAHSVFFSGSTSLLTLFRHFLYLCWSTCAGSFHHPSVSIVVYLGCDLTRAISPTTLLSEFPFFSTCLDTTSLLVKSRTVPVHPIESSDWDLSKIVSSQIFWIWSSSVQLSTSYIITVLVCRIVLILILSILSCLLCKLLVVLISPLTPCILPQMPNYTNFFEC